MRRLHFGRARCVHALALILGSATAACGQTQLDTFESARPGPSPRVPSDQQPGARDGGTGDSSPGEDHSRADAGPSGVGPTICEGASTLDPVALGFRKCDQCADAFCVPNAFVPSGQDSLLAACDSTSKCVPDVLVRSRGMVRLAACTSVAGLEGRCLSTCFPPVRAQAALLPQDVCRAEELCAPCVDPLSGKLTGVCSLGCDPGPSHEEPPAVAACCGGLGACVPGSLVPAEQQGLLGRDSCGDAQEVCVPRDLITVDYRPPQCRSVSGFEGRCLPACLPAVAALAEALPADRCADGHLCAPCFDPRTGQPTGACSVNGDAPSSSPEDNQLARCCTVTGGSQLGLCVPEAFVPEAQRTLLPRDTCAEGHRCVPEEQVANPGAPFPSCDVGAGCKSSGAPAVGAAQFLPGSDSGVCMPECLLQSRNEDAPIPDLVQNGRKTCEQGRVCVACEIRACLLSGCRACDVASLGTCSTGACGGELSCF